MFGLAARFAAAERERRPKSRDQRNRLTAVYRFSSGRQRIHCRSLQIAGHRHFVYHQTMNVNQHRGRGRLSNRRSHRRTGAGSHALLPDGWPRPNKHRTSRDGGGQSIHRERTFEPAEDGSFGQGPSPRQAPLLQSWRFGCCQRSGRAKCSRRRGAKRLRAHHAIPAAHGTHLLRSSGGHFGRGAP